jgi:hypothetical protein
MCSLRIENNLLTFEGVRFASISKKTPLSKLSFTFVSLALPLLLRLQAERPAFRSDHRERASFVPDVLDKEEGELRPAIRNG